jgi:hypothetical protein
MKSRCWSHRADLKSEKQKTNNDLSIHGQPTTRQQLAHLMSRNNATAITITDQPETGPALHQTATFNALPNLSDLISLRS